MRAPGGGTRLAAVIGSPVRHSLSPVLHNAAFEATGLDWVYVAFEVPPGGAKAALDAVRALAIEGLSVTMPHKTDVAAAVDVLSPEAAALQSVNCVVRRGDVLEGHSTDGPGFIDSLAAEGVTVAGRRVVVLGAGGAARAVVRSLADAAAASVVVVNRSVGPAEVAAALAGPVGSVGAPGDVAGADLVVNATPVGMGEPASSGALPIDPAALRDGQVVADLIYHPAETALLAVARARGCVVVGGLGMLIHQAAHAFRLWTGVDAPVGAMAAAAQAHLASRA